MTLSRRNTLAGRGGMKRSISTGRNLFCERDSFCERFRPDVHARQNTRYTDSKSTDARALNFVHICRGEYKRVSP